MTTEEVAEKVVEFCRKQAWKEALDTLYAVSMRYAARRSGLSKTWRSTA